MPLSSSKTCLQLGRFLKDIRIRLRGQGASLLFPGTLDRNSFPLLLHWKALCSSARLNKEAQGIFGNRRVIIFPKQNYDSSTPDHIESFGKIFMLFATTRIMMTLNPEATYQDAKRYTEEIIKDLSAKYSEDHDGHFLAYVGKLCLSDSSIAQKFLITAAFDEKQRPRMDYLDYFNSIYPRSLLASIDQSYIWDSSFPLGPLELPRLDIDINKLHPIFLLSKSDAKSLIDSSAKKSGHSFSEIMILSKLEDLSKLGELTFSFLLLYHILRKYNSSTLVFDDLVKNSSALIDKVVRFSGIDCILMSSTRSHGKTTANDRRFIFYRYIALFALCNEQSFQKISDWLSALLDYCTELERVDIGYLGKPSLTQHLEANNDVPIPVLPETFIQEKIFSQGDLDPVLIENIKLLGKDFVKFAIDDLVIKTNFSSYKEDLWRLEEKYTKLITLRVAHSVEANIKAAIAIGSTELKSDVYLIIGILALQSSENCNRMLHRIFLNEDLTYKDCVNYIKWLYMKGYLPTLRIEEPSHSQNSIFKLPTLEDNSRVTRFMLLSNAVLHPKTSKKSLGIDYSQSIGVLKTWQRWGNHYYRICLRRSLILHLNLKSSGYITDLYKQLTSENFKKFVLDRSGILSLIKNSEYDDVLLQNRYAKNLSDSLLSQYLGALYLCDHHCISSWTDSLVVSFMSVINELNNEEVHHLLEDFSKTIRSHKFSLYRRHEDKIMKLVETGGLKVDLPVLERASEVDYMGDIGKEFVDYVSAKFHLEKGLDSFITAKDNSLIIIDKIINSLRKPEGSGNITLAELIGNFILEKGSLCAENLLLENLERTSFEERSHFRLQSIPHIDVVKEEINLKPLFSIWDKISLPNPPRKSVLSDLLLVNFFISRSFLSSIGATTKNINRLPDYCTKFNTMGGHYYKFLVYKYALLVCTSQLHAVPSIIVRRVVNLLLDRAFMAVVCDKSGVFYKPFKLNIYTSLARRYTKNEFYFLRFFGQTFKQYMGLLCYENMELADQWVSYVFDAIIHHLENKPLAEQGILLDDIQREVLEHNAKCRLK